MKRRIPWYIVIVIIAIAVASCGYVYTLLPIGLNPNPVMPKGSNRPPPGRRKEKSDATKAAQAAKAKTVGADKIVQRPTPGRPNSKKVSGMLRNRIESHSFGSSSANAPSHG